MDIFVIVILINVVLKWLSFLVIRFYTDMNLSDEVLGKSFVFNIAGVVYLINTVMLYANATILAALFIKEYFL